MVGLEELLKGLSQILVRTVGKIETIEDIKSVPIGRRGERVVSVADVADVKLDILPVLDL